MVLGVGKTAGFLLTTYSPTEEVLVERIHFVAGSGFVGTLRVVVYDVSGVAADTVQSLSLCGGNKVPGSKVATLYLSHRRLCS